jgi:hypothetical protein
MKTIKVTHAQHRALQTLTRKDISLLKKYPKILAESRQLLRTCKKVINQSTGSKNSRLRARPAAL